MNEGAQVKARRRRKPAPIVPRPGGSFERRQVERTELERPQQGPRGERSREARGRHEDQPFADNDTVLVRARVRGNFRRRGLRPDREKQRT